MSCCILFFYFSSFSYLKTQFLDYVWCVNKRFFFCFCCSFFYLLTHEIITQWIRYHAMYGQRNALYGTVANSFRAVLCEWWNFIFSSFWFLIFDFVFSFRANKQMPQITLSFPNSIALKHSPSKRKSLSKAAQRSTENESETNRKYTLNSQ